MAKIDKINENPNNYDEDLYNDPPRKKNVSIQYYPYLAFNAKWASTSLMDLKMIRMKSLEIWDGTSTSNKNYLGGYQFDERWELEIMLYKDTNSKGKYQKFQSEQEHIKRRALEAEKVQEQNKVLNEF